MFDSAFLEIEQSHVEDCTSLVGGCLFQRGHSQATLSGTSFKGCRAQSEGGTVFLADYAQSNFSSSTIENGWSGSVGSGFMAQDFARFNIITTLITHNSSPGGGSGLYVSSGASATVSSSQFIRNVATSNGGAVLMTTNRQAFSCFSQKHSDLFLQFRSFHGLPIFRQYLWFERWSTFCPRCFDSPIDQLSHRSVPSWKLRGCFVC